LASRIHACLLVANRHPLLTDDVFKMLSAAAEQAGWAFDYRCVDLNRYWP